MNLRVTIDYCTQNYDSEWSLINDDELEKSVRQKTIIDC